MSKGSHLFILLLLLFPLQLSSQEIPLQGIVADFPNFPHEGTPFWDERQFVEGDIFLDGRLYTRAALQIDAMIQDVIVGVKGYPPFYPGKERVAWFTRGHDLFVNFRYWIPSAPEGFFRLLGQEKDCFSFEQTRKYLIADVRSRFSSQTSYYQFKDGKVSKGRRMDEDRLTNTHQTREQLIQCLSSGSEMPDSTESGPVLFYPLPQAADTSAALWRTAPEDSVAWREQIRSSYISAEQLPVYKGALTGIIKVSAQELARIPTPLGERDPMKALLSLPGVKTVGEASGGLNIRGGGADQNLILLQGNTLFGTGHMFGLLSSLNPDLIHSVELYTGSIPAEYGGRISSVLDIALKDGAEDRLRGSASIGLMTSRFHLEGPIGKKVSFIAGARTTYSNWLMRLLPPTSAYKGGQADFKDATAHIVFRPDSLNTMRLSFYASGDSFSFSADTLFGYSNLNTALNWKHYFNSEKFLTVSMGYDQYGHTYQQSDNDFSSFRLARGIRQLFLRPNIQQSTGNHYMKYGSDFVCTFLRTGDRTPLTSSSLVAPLSITRQQAAELAFFFSDYWSVTEHLALDLGARGNLYVGREAVYFVPEIRLSGKYSFLRHFSVKGGIGNMTQNLHTVSNTTSASPMDAWTLSSRQFGPTRGVQSSAGFYWDIPSLGLKLSLEGYYKWIVNSVDYRSGATIIMNENLDADLVSVRGKAWGAEYMVRRNRGKLTGWASYTYSRSLLKDLSEPSSRAINGGAWYPASYDKPHEVKIAANYAFTRRYSLSANLEYATGRPVTIPIGQFDYGGGSRLAYSYRNTHRIPDYFRMDLAFNIEPSHYLKALTHMTFTIGCYNVTGRKNPYSVYYTTENGKTLKAYYISVFAVPIPYVNVNLSF